MCMGNKYLINREDLGKRTIGYVIYNSTSKDFVGMTAKQIKESIKNGVPVYGFTLAEDNTLHLDKDNFHTTNYMVRSGINSISPAYDHNGMANMFYVVVDTYKDTNNQTVYEVVNSRYGRTEVNEAKIRVLVEIGAVQGGAYLDSKNKLIVCHIPVCNKDTSEMGVS